MQWYITQKMRKQNHKIQLMKYNSLQCEIAIELPKPRLSSSVFPILSLQTSDNICLQIPVHTLSSPESEYVHISRIYTISCCFEFGWNGFSQGHCLPPLPMDECMGIMAMSLWCDIFFLKLKPVMTSWGYHNINIFSFHFPPFPTNRES